MAYFSSDYIRSIVAFRPKRHRSLFRGSLIQKWRPRSVTTAGIFVVVCFALDKEQSWGIIGSGNGNHSADGSVDVIDGHANGSFGNDSIDGQTYFLSFTLSFYF